MCLSAIKEQLYLLQSKLHSAWSCVILLVQLFFNCTEIQVITYVNNMKPVISSQTQLFYKCLNIHTMPTYTKTTKIHTKVVYPVTCVQLIIVMTVTVF